MAQVVKLTNTIELYMKCLGIYSGLWTHIATSLTSPKVEFINAGRKIVVYNKLINNRWFKLYDKDTYIPIEFKDFNGIASLTSYSDTKFIKCVLKNHFGINTQIKIYNKPSMRSKIIGNINNNEILLVHNSMITQTKQKWYKLAISNGFIRSEYSIMEEDFKALDNFDICDIESLNIVDTDITNTDITNMDITNADDFPDTQTKTNGVKQDLGVIELTTIFKSITCDSPEFITKELMFIPPQKIVSKATPIQKRKTIPKRVKELVWEAYFGDNIAKSICPLCERNEIKITNFHCSHIIPAALGGTDTVDNLRPLCSGCNLSMGDQNMNDYIKQFHPNSKLNKHNKHNM